MSAFHVEIQPVEQPRCVESDGANLAELLLRFHLPAAHQIAFARASSKVAATCYPCHQKANIEDRELLRLLLHNAFRDSPILPISSAPLWLRGWRRQSA